MRKKFDTFGVMIDMSRNAVMSMDALKRFLPLLKKMGYNCVMLYTEDTYEIDGEPYFGYMRGRYTKAEMKELDAFAASLGMTMIPCVQTLAHLNATVRWNQLPRDYGDILMIDDERTYEFIDRMFATLSECFGRAATQKHTSYEPRHCGRHGAPPHHGKSARSLERQRNHAKGG